MSTNLGRAEGMDDPRGVQGPGLRPYVSLTRFAGRGGPCLQLTVHDQHVQMTRAQVEAFIEKLRVYQTAEEDEDA